jgi:hypothetical protein
VEVEGNVDDEDLPMWAKRSSFVDNELGENASTQQYRIFLTIPARRHHSLRPGDPTTRTVVRSLHSMHAHINANAGQ